MTPEQRAFLDWQLVRLKARRILKRRRYWTAKRVRDLGYNIERTAVDRAVRMCGQ